MCFSTKGVFGKIEKVEYCEEREYEYTRSDKVLAKFVRNSLSKKSIGWSYEKEWRIIKKSQAKYLHFQEDDLRGVIFGHDLEKEVCDFIKSNMNRKLPLMETKVGYRSYSINAIRLNYKYDYNGVPIKVLDVEKTLQRGRYILGK